MDVFDPFDALIVDLGLQVLLRDLLSELLSPVHSLESLTFLEGRSVDILLLGQCESKGTVQYALQ